MKRTKKLLCLVLALTLLVTVLAGCGKKDDVATDGKVNLKWMMLGLGEQKDSQMVWDAFNEQLPEYIPDTTVDFKVFATSEYAEKYKLMSAANDQQDLLWIGWLIDYVTESKKGSFYPMGDLLDKYGEDIKKEIPMELIDSLRVDGELYQLPNYQMIIGGRAGIAVHNDDLEKYSNFDKIKDVLYAHDTMTEECYDVIEEYLEALKANGDMNLGVSTQTFGNLVQKGYQIFTDYHLVVRRDDENFEVLNYYKTPEMKLFYEKMNDWYKKGYIRRDILTVDNPTQDEGKPDGYDLWVTQFLDERDVSLTAQYGFNVGLIPQGTEFYYDGGSGTGTAISANSINPDRAMQVLDLVNTEKGKDIYNLLVYGIEGTHFNKVSDTRIETLAYQGAPDSNSAYGQYKWVVGNTFNAYEIPGDMEGYNDYIRGLNETCVKSPIAGFVFDSTPVKTEIAQINAVSQEFVRALNSGAVADYEDYYNKMISKLDSAGMDKYIAEMQKQIDEYVKLYVK